MVRIGECEILLRVFQKTRKGFLLKITGPEEIINMRKQWIPVSINNESESSPGRTGKRNGDYDLSV